MQIITRAEAREQQKPRYFTGKPCRYGHLAERFTLDARCINCSRNHSAKSRSRHLETRRAADREYARTHAEERSSYHRNWVAENREKVAAANRDWRLQNRERRLDHHKRYYAAKIRATPPWVDKAAIEDFYSRCPNGMTVDHVVPLQGELVSGLHVPWNLQYLTPVENSSKGNRHPDHYAD